MSRPFSFGRAVISVDGERMHLHDLLVEARALGISEQIIASRRKKGYNTRAKLLAPLKGTPEWRQQLAERRQAQLHSSHDEVAAAIAALDERKRIIAEGGQIL